MSITKLDLATVEQILTSGEFDMLLQTVEHECLDCKGQVYVTRGTLSKVELTKDVAAFANSGGGYILIGVQTTKSPLHKGDDIIAIKPFAQDVCDTDSYRNVINAGIYPSVVRHVRINWYPSKADKSKGIVAIRIAPECKSERPYLISHVEVEAQGITTGKLIGFYERIDDDAEPMKVQELRELLKKGMHSGVVLQRLDDMQATLAELATRQEQPKSSLDSDLRTMQSVPVEDLTNSMMMLTAKPAFDEAELSRRFLEAKRAAGLDNLPLIVLAAYPPWSINFEKIFDSRTSKEAQLLERPPVFRQGGGFDLNTHQQSQIVQAKLRRCVAQERKILELWKDGLLLFIGRGDSDFLGWAVGPKRGQALA